MERARELGFLGPGEVEGHVRHAMGFAGAVGQTGVQATRVVDLGSGGGIPGLVLATMWARSSFALVEAGRRRADFLKWAVGHLSLGDRVTVLASRAEEVGHDPSWRERADVLVARSFAAPAMTAECATGLVRPGGVIVVSDPPSPGIQPDPAPPDPAPPDPATCSLFAGSKRSVESPSRECNPPSLRDDHPGPMPELPAPAPHGASARWPPSELAILGLRPAGVSADGFSFQVLSKTGSCGYRYPRRAAAIAKRPLYR